MRALIDAEVAERPDVQYEVVDSRKTTLLHFHEGYVGFGPHEIGSPLLISSDHAF